MGALIRLGTDDRSNGHPKFREQSLNFFFFSFASFLYAFNTIKRCVEDRESQQMKTQVSPSLDTISKSDMVAREMCRQSSAVLF